MCPVSHRTCMLTRNYLLEMRIYCIQWKSVDFLITLVSLVRKIDGLKNNINNLNVTQLQDMQVNKSNLKSEMEIYGYPTNRERRATTWHSVLKRLCSPQFAYKRRYYSPISTIKLSPICEKVY